MKFNEDGSFATMTDREATSYVKKTTLKWTLIIVAMAILVPICVWIFTVVTSDTKGKGDQIIRNNSEVNRTEQQQMFEDLYAQIISLDQRIDLAKQAVDTDIAAGKDTTISQQNLLGAQNVCLEAIGDYNAAARKVLAKDWRSPDLPQEIDQSDSATDCMPKS
jgi:uncharacterized protein YlxW (UPF0749 family)